MLFAGGWIGSGTQYASWIHMDDVVNAILFPIDHESITGPYNVASPAPVTMKEFSAVLGKALNRPSWIPVPDFALKILYGEIAETLTAGQRVVPQKLLECGFSFSFPDLGTALTDILR